MAQFARKMFDVYTPETARYKAMTEGADIMAEYLSMRKVAQERLRKLKKAGRESDAIYRDNTNRFPGKKEIGSDVRMLYDALSEVSHFLAEQKSTVGGLVSYESKALSKLTKHYASEGITGMSWKAFGKMMQSIRTHARGKAYYRTWKSAYRAALSNAKKAGLTESQLNEAVSRGEIKIGVRGGLTDAAGRRIRGKWSRMGK